MKKNSISSIKRNRGSLTPDKWFIGAQIIQLEEFRFLLNYRKSRILGKSIWHEHLYLYNADRAENQNLVSALSNYQQNLMSVFWVYTKLETVSKVTILSCLAFIFTIFFIFWCSILYFCLSISHEHIYITWNGDAKIWLTANLLYPFHSYCSK